MKNSKQNLKSKANKFSWKKKNLAYQGSTCKNSAFRSTKKQLVRSWSSGLINLFYRDTLQSLTLWTSHYATRFMWSDWTGKMGSSVMVIEKFTLQASLRVKVQAYLIKLFPILTDITPRYRSHFGRSFFSIVKIGTSKMRVIPEIDIS